MTNMKDYLAWVKQNQQNNPEWRDAGRWQNRNQTPVNPPKPTQPNGLPEGTEIVDEQPKE